MSVLGILNDIANGILCHKLGFQDCFMSLGSFSWIKLHLKYDLFLKWFVSYKLELYYEENIFFPLNNHTNIEHWHLCVYVCQAIEFGGVVKSFLVAH